MHPRGSRRDIDPRQILLVVARAMIAPATAPRVRPSRTNEQSLRNTQNAQPFCGHLVDRVSERGNVCRTQIAKISDCFRRAFGGDNEFSPSVRCLPYVRHGEETGSKPVGMSDRFPVKSALYFHFAQLRIMRNARLCTC
jgi:hypothetical protein